MTDMAYKYKRFDNRFHPTPEQVQVVIDNLKKAHERIDLVNMDIAKVNMIITRDKDTNEIMELDCETPACHAGSYLIARAMDRKFTVERLQEMIDETLEVNPALKFSYSPDACDYMTEESNGGIVQKTNLFYEMGCEEMARDLGFRSSSDLLDWAELFPEIWGCSHGSTMFDEESEAFDDIADDTGLYEDLNMREMDMSIIIMKWEKVKKNLEKVESIKKGEDND